MALPPVGRTELDTAGSEPSPEFEGIGALGWVFMFAIALAALILMSNL
jgi:hypothetical protein